MIVITGSAGFIGSYVTGKLNQYQYRDLVLVDDFSKTIKKPNYENKTFTTLVDRDHFFSWLEKEQKFVQFIIHLGARTDTTEFDTNILNNLNLEYSKKVWNACLEYGIPLIYASSAATYGDGKLGYSDKHDLCNQLHPLNPYGVSKNEFDKWVLQQKDSPFFWAGLKFFNVYGPNEYHKGRMASVVYHAFNQIKQTGFMKLFRSHNPDFRDGEQLRDFIYVADVAEVIVYLMENRPLSGIFNLGSGKARSFNDLVQSTFNAMDIKPKIEYIDTPLDIRDKYQYFTEADVNKLRMAGYTREFTPIEEGVEDYVRNYLTSGSVF